MRLGIEGGMKVVKHLGGVWGEVNKKKQISRGAAYTGAIIRKIQGGALRGTLWVHLGGRCGVVVG